MPDSRSLAAKTPTLEWIAAGIGLLFLIALVAAIGHDAMTGASTAAPVIEIRPTEIRQTMAGYRVSFTAINHAGGTAAAVEVEGRVRTGAQTETSSATIDYVPGGGHAEGALIFTTDPRRGRLSLSAIGYQRP